MEMLTNVLNKRTKIFQIATWVCAGVAFLGLLLPYVSFMGENAYLFSVLTENDSPGAFIALLLLFLVLIALAVVVIKYDSFNFVASIILAGGAILAEILYCIATGLPELELVEAMLGKSIGGKLTSIFLILFIIVGVIAVAAEVYVKYFAEKVASGTTANTTQAKGWFCPQCGAPNEANGKFCNKCGTQKPE